MELRQNAIKTRLIFVSFLGSLDKLGRFMEGKSVIKTRLNVKIMDDKMVREKNN